MSCRWFLYAGDEVLGLTVGALANVADLRVPLEVDTAYGTTWFDAQKH